MCLNMVLKLILLKFEPLKDSLFVIFSVNFDL